MSDTTARVDVWTIPLDGPSPTLDVLSAAERERAARFVFDRDRRRYIAAHVAMRRILGTVLGRAPHLLAFTEGPHGKPALMDAPRVHFNLSHSDELAVLAVSPHAEVGVDLEAATPMTDADAVAEAHFSPAELAAWRQLPAPERLPGFYRLWTRKEAFIKAVGTGLSYPLERFTVDIDAEHARVLEIDGDAERAAAWSVAPLALETPYVGAVAMPVPALAVTLRSGVA